MGVSIYTKQHWEKVYSTKATDKVSWFQEHAALSLKLIQGANIPFTASIIDVGGGASTLVDDLLLKGYENITVLDIAEAAIAKAKVRLKESSSVVQRVEASVIESELPALTYDVWHDRAVFHFLTEVKQRQAYVKKLLHAVKPCGLIIVATFAEDGPTKCSGLPVARYGEMELFAEFGEPLFTLIGSEKESHFTPEGNEQKFVYCAFRKVTL